MPLLLSLWWTGYSKPLAQPALSALRPPSNYYGSLLKTTPFQYVRLHLWEREVFTGSFIRLNGASLTIGHNPVVMDRYLMLSVGIAMFLMLRKWASTLRVDFFLDPTTSAVLEASTDSDQTFFWYLSTMH